jgi:hypothetical protein
MKSSFIFDQKFIYLNMNGTLGKSGVCGVVKKNLGREIFK